MSAVLWVPVHLDALVLRQGMDVADTHVRFERLPYLAKGQDIAADDAFLGDIITSKPLEDQALHLSAGIHLHWALPDALTHGEQDDTGEIVFPVVPDRWVVVRLRDANPEAAWIVESNYLYPEGTGALSGSIAFPIDISDKGQPFRFMGRAISIQDYDAIVSQTPESDYFPNLTAVGYGDPYFASFYPNCKSVFGFHDQEIDINGSLAGLSYYVVGLYAHIMKQDPIYQWSQTQAVDVAFETLKEDLEKKFSWRISEESEAALPQQTFCYGRVDFAQEPNDTMPTQSPEVAIGHSGTEALAAYLAKLLTSDHDKQADFEKQIEGLFLNREWINRPMDAEALLEVARHAGGFQSISGGVLWTILAQENDASASDSTPETTPQTSFITPDIGYTLGILNHYQKNYQEGIDQLTSLKRQLFADWYKFMVAAYPPEGSTEPYLDADALRVFIQDRDLAPLETLQKQLGTLQGELDAQGDFNPMGKVSGTPDTRAGLLADTIQVLQAQVHALNQTEEVQKANVQYMLGLKPAPRYWQPGEPAILLVGDAVQPSERYGRDGVLNCDLALVNTLSNGTYGGSLAEIVTTWITQHTSPNPWSGQPWHPFMIEWEVEFFPSLQQGNHETDRFAYQADYICNNYKVPPDQPEYSPLRPLSYAQGASVYEGRTILSGHASLLLKEAVASYLDKEQVPPSLKVLYENLQTILEGQTHPSLSLTLGGFNEALLMREQAYQLPIKHPLGFEEEQIFTDQVAAAVEHEGTSAPQPLWQYNPIRAGLLNISNLQLIDSFGRSLPVDVAKGTVAQTMSTPALPNLISLSPRIVQPARLDVRWVSGAVLDPNLEIETNDAPQTSPVIGWLIPQFLDQSLYFYDASGNLLGWIDRKRKIHSWEKRRAFRYHLSLVNIVNNIANYTEEEWQTFFHVASEALHRIEPETIDAHTEAAWLLGQPLALVRASIHLEIKGFPEPHLGWAAMQMDLERNLRETHDFEKVRFPIRLGDYNHLHDGVVGYWLESNLEAPDQAFYSTIPTPISHERFKNANEHVLEQTIASPPQTVVILADIRGDIHLSTGILPLKTLSIPSIHYQEAIKNMELMWFSAPILSPSHPPQIPLPSIPSQAWVWHQRNGDSWESSAELTPEKPVEASLPEVPSTGSDGLSEINVLYEGWLGLHSAS